MHYHQPIAHVVQTPTSTEMNSVGIGGVSHHTNNASSLNNAKCIILLIDLCPAATGTLKLNMAVQEHSDRGIGRDLDVDLDHVAGPLNPRRFKGTDLSPPENGPELAATRSRHKSTRPPGLP